MAKTRVLFVQGGGEGAHAEDAPLVDSLKHTLGPEFVVRFPRMPHEGDPNVESWKKKISSELSDLTGRIVLVAHSIGGSILLRYLSEEKIEKPIVGVFLLAAPSWDADRWNFDDLKLSSDLAERLAAIPHIYFYHCRDDDVVPFAHLALHGARLPRAVSRPFHKGGHQFDKHLSRIAGDIRGLLEREGMLNHIVVGSNDIERSKRFYDAVLGTLGATEPLRNAASSGHVRLFYRHNGSTFCVSEPINGEVATAANGGTIGFKCDSPEQVREFHDVALKYGGKSIEDPPGPRDGSLGPMHLAYVRDPDGNKLCAIFRAKPVR